MQDKGYAEAEIPMYRFADYNVVNIQCDILICKGKKNLASFFLTTVIDKPKDVSHILSLRDKIRSTGRRTGYFHLFVIHLNSENVASERPFNWHYVFRRVLGEEMGKLL